MKTMEDRDDHQSHNTPQANPHIEKLRRDSQETSPELTERFRNLAQAIREASNIELSCEECHTLFDVYIDQLLEGQEAAEHYPAVWQHLESCTHCRTDLETIVSLLKEERHAPVALTSATQDVREALPFLNRKPAKEGWFSRVRSQLAGALPGFEIRLGLDFLRNALSSSSRLEPGMAMRSVANPLAMPETDTRLLLIELVSFQGQQINIQLESEHNPDSEHIVLHAILAGESALPRNLWVQLTWAGHTYDAPVALTEDDEEGHVKIENVRLADLNEAADEQVRFDISFEVRSP